MLGQRKSFKTFMPDRQTEEPLSGSGQTRPWRPGGHRLPGAGASEAAQRHCGGPGQAPAPAGPARFGSGLGARFSGLVVSSRSGVELQLVL